MAASTVRTTPFPSYQEPEIEMNTTTTNNNNNINTAPASRAHHHNSWGATDPWVNVGMEYQFPASQKQDYGQAQDQGFGKSERLIDVTPLPDQPAWGNQDYAAQVPVANGEQQYGNADQGMLGGMEGNAWGETNVQEAKLEFQYQKHQPNSPLPTQYQLNKPTRGCSTMQNAENVIQLRIQNAVLQNELRHARFAKDEAVQSSVLITRSLARVIPQVQAHSQSQSQGQQTAEQHVYVPRQYPAPVYPPGLVRPQPQQRNLVQRPYPAPKYPPGLTQPQAQQNDTIDRRLTVPTYPPSLTEAQQQQHITVDRPYPAPAFPPGLPQPQLRGHVQRLYPAPAFPPGLTKPAQPVNEQYAQTQTQAAERSTDNAVNSLRSSLESMQKEILVLRSENSELKERMRSMIEIPDGAQKIMLVDGSLLDLETLSMEAERVSARKNVEHKEFVIGEKLKDLAGDEYVSLASPTKKPRRRVGERMRDHRLSNQAEPQSGLATTKDVFNDEATSISAESLTESRTLPPPQPKFWKPDTSRVSVQGNSWHDDDVFAPAPGEKGKELGDLGMHSLDDILGSDSGVSEDDVSMPTTPGKESHNNYHGFSADVEIKEGQFQTVDISRYQNMKFPSPKIEKTGFEIEQDKVVKGREYDFEKEKKAELELSGHTRALIRARVGDPPRMGGHGDHHFTRDYNRFNTSFGSAPEFGYESSFDLPSDHNQNGLWNSREERQEAFVTHKQVVVRSRGTEPVFPDLFRYGIQYVPAETDGNYIRAVIITDLPKDIKMRDVLARVRGGEIVSAVLMDTTKLTGGMSALVVFVIEGAAAEYVEYTTSYPISFITESCPTAKRATTWLIKTPTFPMNVPMKNRIYKHGQTRCLLISNLSTPIDHNEIHHLTRDLAGGGVNKPGNTYRAESLVDIFVDDEEGSIKLEFASINIAGSSYGMLTAFRHYRHLAVHFVEDPCSRPLSDLSAPVGPKKPDHNRLPLYRPQEFVSPFQQEYNRPTPLVMRSSSSERESFANRMRNVKTNGDLWKSLADSESAKNEKTGDEVGDNEADAIPKMSSLKLRLSPTEIPSYGGSWADEMMEEAQDPTNTTPDTTSQLLKGDPESTTPAPSTPGLSPSDSLTPILIDVLTPKTSSQKVKVRDEEKEKTSSLSRRPNLDYGGFRKPPVGLAGSKYATAVPSFSDNMPTPTAHPRSRGGNDGVTPRALGLSREGSKLRFGVSATQNEGLLIDTSVRSAVKQRRSEEDLKEAFGVSTPVAERPLIDTSVHTTVKRRKSEEDLKEAFGLEPSLIDTSTRSVVKQRKSEDDLKEAFGVGTADTKKQSKIISAKEYLQQLKEQESAVNTKMQQQNESKIAGDSVSWTSQQALGSGPQKRKQGFESKDPRVDTASRDFAQVDEFAVESDGKESKNPDEIFLSDTEDEREINTGHMDGIAVEGTKGESLAEQESESPYEISLPDSEGEDGTTFEHIEKREDIALSIDDSI